MNKSTAENPVQWLFLDLNAFFASCEQQEAPALRGKPVIVVQTLTESAVAIAASYAAKAFGIKTGTLMREARQLCPAVIPVQANHRLYTEYHERILKAVDTCKPVEKVCSIDEMACKLMGTERQVSVARELALKIKRALRDQVGRMPHLLDRHRAQRVSRQGRVRSAETGRARCHHQRQPAGHSARSRIAGHLRHRRAHGAALTPCRHSHRRTAVERDAVPAAPRVGRHQWRAVPSDAAWRRYSAALLPLLQKHRPPACAGTRAAQQKGRASFRAASLDQGGRTATPRRLLLPASRRASFLGWRSRRLVGRNRFSRNARHRLSARPPRGNLAARAAVQTALRRRRAARPGSCRLSPAGPVRGRQ
jgi:DNA-binding transcriptional MerR regulator